MSGATQILDAYWDRFLAVEPLFATAVGDARFDALLPDPSEAGRAERHRLHTGLLQAAAGIDASGLDPEQRRTFALAVALARRELGWLTHHLDRLWAVGHMPIGHRHGPGCCWAWWRSSNPLPPHRNGLPICDGWPRSRPTLPPWPPTPPTGSPAAWSRPRRSSPAPSGRSNGCWPHRWPTARRWCRWSAATRNARAGPRCSLSWCTRPTPGSWRCCGTTCRGPNRRWGWVRWLAGRSATAARSWAGRRCHWNPTSCTSSAVSSCNSSRSNGWHWRAGSGTPTRPRRSPPTRAGRAAGVPGGDPGVCPRSGRPLLGGAARLVWPAPWAQLRGHAGRPGP
jgi:hypothetical protein